MTRRSQSLDFSALITFSCFEVLHCLQHYGGGNTVLSVFGARDPSSLQLLNNCDFE